MSEINYILLKKRIIRGEERRGEEGKEELLVRMATESSKSGN